MLEVWSRSFVGGCALSSWLVWLLPRRIPISRVNPIPLNCRLKKIGKPTKDNFNNRRMIVRLIVSIRWSPELESKQQSTIHRYGLNPSEMSQMILLRSTVGTKKHIFEKAVGHGVTPGKNVSTGPVIEITATDATRATAWGHGLPELIWDWYDRYEGGYFKCSTNDHCLESWKSIEAKKPGYIPCTNWGYWRWYCHQGLHYGCARRGVCWHEHGDLYWDNGSYDPYFTYTNIKCTKSKQHQVCNRYKANFRKVNDLSGMGPRWK